MDRNIYLDIKRRRVQQSIISNINVTPLVDVMLVLLIIFMITSPMLSSAIKVDLPESKISNEVHEDEPLVISIDKNSKIYVSDTKINNSDLAEKLKARKFRHSYFS